MGNKGKLTTCGLIFIYLCLLSSCQKETLLSDGRFIGSWISTELDDTLIFLSDTVFEKPIKFTTHVGINHRYIYNYTFNNITIQYLGPHKILVQPSTHHYKLRRNELIINFTNGCYTFERKEIKFIRE